MNSLLKLVALLILDHCYCSIGKELDWEECTKYCLNLKCERNDDDSPLI
jgi:hypothetical protein